MRIEKSNISMAATRTYQTEAEEVMVAVNRQNGGQRTVTEKGVTQSRQQAVEGGVSQFSTSRDGVVFEQEEAGISYMEAQQDLEITANQPRQSSQAAVQAPKCEDNWLDIVNKVNEDPKIQMLRKMLELLEQFTGKKSGKNILDLPAGGTARTGGVFQMSAASVSMRYQETMALFGGVSAAPAANAQGSANGHWTRHEVRSGFVSGEENTAFTSSGTVVTSDGRTINFGVSLEMSRSFTEVYASVKDSEAASIYTDPLVINLDTDAASLSDVKFYFDLDCDGKEEQISGLNASSGFLALDRNGDGKINDGSELFGARTGDGFGELSQYDRDGNGWIDENDPIFSKLKVWVKCGSGEGQLLSLSEAGVGAIFLGSQGTQFDLASSQGSTGARVRRTGVYLKESGQVGTVQHVDFKS